MSVSRLITPASVAADLEKKEKRKKEREASTYTALHLQEFLQLHGAKISIDDIKAEMCKRSFFYFFQQFIGTIEPRKFVFADSLDSLVSLLKDETESVRLCAGAHLLFVCPVEVEETLLELEKKNDLLGFDAMMTLREWRKGNLSFD